ncbi:HET domain-containing protein [Microdochium nivale]|nr:HET domain-containing protein [Microdochium nivale]
MASLAHMTGNNLYLPLTDSPVSGNNSSPDALWAARFVTLLRGNFGDPIQCQLLNSTMGDMEGKYEALSYTWGDPADKYQACVSNMPFPITRNLEAALRHLRLQHCDRILWIDSICINQGDVAEVGMQVQRMWAIYEKACQVVVFLGPRADGSDEALGLLSELATAQPGLNHDRVSALLEQPDKADSWQFLLLLLQRSWWSRAWIIQEYAVARVVIFVCGFTEMTDECFGQALELLVDYRFNGSVPHHHQRLIRHVASTPIHHLWSTRQNYRKTGPDSRLGVATILYRFRGSKSFDPRDKVYSLYKLIDENISLKPDYEKSTVDLFQDVVQVMIETSGTLEVLSHHNGQARQDGQGLVDLPSWCPDWTVMRGKRILLWPNRYQASPPHNEPAIFRIDKGILTLRGKILDKVAWLEAFESDDFKDIANIHRRILGIKVKARQMAEQGASAGTLEDAIHRTLVAERLRKNGPSQEATVLGTSEANSLWSSWSQEVQDGGQCHGDESRCYNDALYSAMCGRAFIITDKGTLGLADGLIRVGDVIGAFSGGQVPLALRLWASSSGVYPANIRIPNQYQLVGECFLHGYMSDSAFQSIRQDFDEILLV